MSGLQSHFCGPLRNVPRPNFGLCPALVVRCSLPQAILGRLPVSPAPAPAFVIRQVLLAPNQQDGHSRVETTGSLGSILLGCFENYKGNHGGADQYNVDPGVGQRPPEAGLPPLWVAQSQLRPRSSR